MVGWTFTKLAICSVDFDGVSPGPTKSTENTQGLKTIDFVTAFLYIYITNVRSHSLTLSQSTKKSLNSLKNRRL